jgi:hypothetical protein
MASQASRQALGLSQNEPDALKKHCAPRACPTRRSGFNLEA